jgi:predicted nuclease with RNAse H fold
LRFSFTKNIKIIGIDFGSKLAGTTSVCANHSNTLELYSSEKKNDADKFLREIISRENPAMIFIDAPLSLPAAYFGKGDDFHFRKCDRELGCMSPMFLGGLTARAIKLKSEFSEIPFYETYPKKMAEVLDFNGYNKKSKIMTDFDHKLKIFLEKSGLNLEKLPGSTHETDAILAWLSGYRFVNNLHLTFGNTEEGIIIV